MNLQQSYLTFQCIVLFSTVPDAGDDRHGSGGYLKHVPVYEDVENPYSTPYDHVDDIDHKDSQQVPSSTEEDLDNDF